MPRTVDHHERRREITYAVWQVLATRGFEAVSLRNVAAAAGVSVGRIQHYFATKEQMVRHGCTALVEQATELFDEDTAGLAPAEALRSLLTHAIPTTETFRVGTTIWYAYLAKSTDDPEIAATLARAQGAAQERATRLISEALVARRPASGPVGDAPDGAANGPGEGLRSEPDARQRALRLLALADGLAIRVLVGQLTATEAVATLDAELAAVGIPPAAPVPRLLGREAAG